MILKPGEQVRSRSVVYTVLKELNQGGNAVAYAAQSAGGEKVFLKQYIAPTIRVPWYRPYLEYQQEMKRRIETSRFKDFSYRFIEFFEHERRYYQVFEFVDTGSSLEQDLERCRKNPDLVPWEQRLLMAKVMMGGINALHRAGIVHSDLKPANVMLIPSTDPSITFKYRLKIIDMDFSLLADRQAPWHGHEGYMGTPGYMSPEHLHGEVPGQASDVFTCGLMLYELLTREGHPYRADDWETAVLGYRARLPSLVGKMPAPAADSDVQHVLHHCLSPRAGERPTAEEVLQTLNGRRTSLPPPPSTRPEAPTLPPPEPGKLARLILRSADGEELSFGIPMEVGRTLCRQLGPESEFWSEPQFHVERDEAGAWYVVHNPKATNETLLNGKKIAGRTKLSANDVLAVGVEARSVAKLPLTVSFR